MLLCAAAAHADVEVQGRLQGDRASPAVIYAPDLAPAALTPPEAHARMRQQHLKFQPAVLPVVEGTAVDFVNEDENAHNVFSPGPEDFDLGLFGKGTRTRVFKTPGPHVILCNVHVEMVAWVLVLKTPVFATAEKDGTFRLRLPPGKHRLVLWRPRTPELERTVDVPESGALQLDWTLP